MQTGGTIVFESDIERDPFLDGYCYSGRHKSRVTTCKKIEERRGYYVARNTRLFRLNWTPVFWRMVVKSQPSGTTVSSGRREKPRLIYNLLLFSR